MKLEDIRHWVFDMDGTLTLAVHDFPAIKVALQIPPEDDILTHLAALPADEAAAKLGLSAVLRVEDGVVEVLPATGKFATGAPLQLVLEHPTRQSDDLRLELLPQGPGWRVQQAVDGEHDWVVQLRDGEGRWRLHGRLPKQQHAARLSPSLGGEH